MKVILLFIITILFYSIHCFNNNDRKFGRLPQLNNHQIAEFYNAVLNLLASLRTVSIDALNYESYFDSTLRDEINYVLARLRGYATNEAQAAEWEEYVRDVLRVYVVRICVRQASAYYDSFAVACREPGQSPSLLMQCIRTVSNLHFRPLNENFRIPNIPDAIVSHELCRILRLPVLAISVTVPPYVRLYLGANSRRFVNTVSDERRNYIGFRDPIPFSPYTNYMNDLQMLRRAIQTIANYWRTASCDLASNVHAVEPYVSSYRMDFVEQCVGSSLYAQAETTLRQIFANSRTFFAQRNTNFLQHTIIVTALLNLMTRFLDAEHCWLAAHPFLYLTAQRRELSTIISEINQLNAEVEETTEQFTASLERLLSPYCMSNASDTLRERLEEQDFAAGYALRRFVNIAIVNSIQADDAESISTESSANKTTQREDTIEKPSNPNFSTSSPMALMI